MKAYILLLFCFFLVSCASSGKRNDISSQDETPMLTEQDFKNAVTNYLQNGGGPLVSTYNIMMADLNGDYLPEGLVMMNTPFSTWCKAAGCTLLIFQSHGGVITLNSRIEPIRGPLFLHTRQGQTWKMIVTRQDGMNREARYIMLQNKGIGYPAFTLNAPPFQGSSPHSGESYFYSD